ncbi:MAG: hypothetical protein RR645_06000, partial [Clostridium sp.]
MKKLLAAFLVINLVFSSFSTVYASVDSNKGEVRNKAQVTFKQRKYLNVSLADTKHFKVSSYQQFYSALDSAIKNVDSSIFITMENGYLQDDIGGFGKVLEKISDFAGVGSFVDSYTYSSSSTGLSGYLVEINYARNIEDVRAKTKEVNNEVDRIVSNITSSKAGDYNNIKAIHDYIVNNTRYDIDRINNLP